MDPYITKKNPRLIPGHDIKLQPVMRPSLFPGPLWPWVDKPDKAPAIDQIIVLPRAGLALQPLKAI